LTQKREKRIKFFRKGVVVEREGVPDLIKKNQKNEATSAKLDAGVGLGLDTVRCCGLGLT